MQLSNIGLYAAGLYAVIGLIVLWRDDPKHFSPFRWLSVVLRVVATIALWPIVSASPENSSQNQPHPAVDEETIEED